MRKLIVLAAIMLLISGCAAIQGKLPSLGFQPGEGKILGPSGSISMEMTYPKEKGQIMKEMSFSPLIQIKNTGSSDARGQVCVTGLDINVFGGAGSCDCQTYSFSKVPDESFQPENLAFGPYALSQDAPDAEYTITAVNRFAYSSKALFKPCIRDKLSMNECSVDISEASNGPVAIMSIQDAVSPSNDRSMVMAFNVELRKVSEGQLVDQSSLLSECSAQQFTIESKKIKPKIYGTIIGLPYIGNVECAQATLNDLGTATMSCMVGEVDLFDESGNYRFSGSYATPSQLIITYGFEEIGSNKFTIGGPKY